MVSRSGAGEGIPSLSVALTDTMKAEELKMLARLTGRRAPVRKAELVEHLLEHLAGRPRLAPAFLLLRPRGRRERVA